MAQINTLCQNVVSPDNETVQSTPSPLRQESPESLNQECSEPIVSRLSSHPKLKEIVLQFTQKVPNEVMKMEQALLDEDYNELAHLAHWLKGAAGTVGYDAFTRPATELEQFAKELARANCKELVKKIDNMVRNIEPPL